MDPIKALQTRIIPLLVIGLAFSFSALGQSQHINFPPLLDEGFHQMYNLQFVQAHTTFAKFMADHPLDPMGPKTICTTPPRPTRR
jgi:hypothetical protein